jgi:hypothetical protein
MHPFLIPAGLADKQSKMSRLGMEVLLPDVALQRHRLMHQYLDAECASQHHIQQVAEVCHKLEAVVEQASTAVPDPGTQLSSLNKLSVFSSI